LTPEAILGYEHMAKISRAYNTAVTVSSKEDTEGVRQALLGIVPVNGFFDLEMGLYWLHRFLALPLLATTGAQEGFEHIIALMREAFSADDVHTTRFLDWWREGLRAAIWPLANVQAIGAAGVESNLGFYSMQNRYSDVRPHLLAQQYAALYEVGFTLETLAALIRLQENESFRERPFEGFRQAGRKIVQKGKIVKGLAVQWLLDQLSDSPAGEVVRQAYCPAMRNSLGGHNDYRFDEDSQTFVSSDCSYSAAEVASRFSILRNLTDLLASLPAEIDYANRMFFDQIAGPRDYGFIDVRFPFELGREPAILAIQSWPFFIWRDAQALPKRVWIYPTPIEGHHNSVSYSFADLTMLFPYDIRLLADRTTLQCYRHLLKHSASVRLTILGVCPYIEPLATLGHPEIDVWGVKQIVLGQVDSVVSLDEDGLKDTIEHLRVRLE